MPPDNAVVLGGDPVHRSPDALLLDLDNTLYEYAPVEAAARKRLVEAVSKDTALSAEAVEVAFLDAREKVKGRLRGRASAHSRLLYLSEMVHALAAPGALCHVLRWEAVFWDEFVHVAELRPRMRDLLGTFRARGGKIAVVTDLTLGIQLRKLAAFDVLGLVDVLVASEEVEGEKPQGDGLALAIARLALAPAARLVVVGDSEEKDGGAALALDLPYVRLACDDDVETAGRALGIWDG